MTERWQAQPTRRAVCAGALALLAAPALGGERVIEDFGPGAEARWQVFSDRVMGGVSTGRATLGEEAGRRFLRLSGTVSTANNGGFLQARLVLGTALAQDAQGLELTVRGDGQPYFVHLRTSRTRLPWQFYQSSFGTGPGWSDVRLDWASFVPKGRGLGAALVPGEIRSLAIAAYGRDHEADVSVARITTF